MVQVYIVVEGETELEFVKSLLNPEFFSSQNAYGNPVRLGLTGGRCGGVSFKRVREHLQSLTAQHKRKGVAITTMIDLYGRDGAWPREEEANAKVDPYHRVQVLEEGMTQSIQATNFIPYLQLHEFEALLLAEPTKLLDYYPHRESDIEKLVSLVQQKGNCELINSTPNGAPSKRIQEVIPEYNKVVGGNSTALNIGLKTLRERCRHFREWLEKLEAAIRAEDERLSP
ncbi:MAG: DUF4276 family protein [Bryobacter sp.]|nr:DUF4276 family protein [Bryobacter sp.]